MVNELDGGGPFGPVVNGTQIVFYHYRPNGEAGWAFLVLFAIGVLGHIGYMFWLRSWHFIPFILGGVGEAFGYYGRAKAHEDPTHVGSFILQNLLILGSPPLFAATIYMSLGRIIIALDLRRHTMISPRLTAFFYVVVDISCFVTQVFGAVMPASGDPDGIKMAKTLIMSGLIAQLAVISLFTLSCWHSHRCAQREASELNATRAGIQWRKYYLMTYAVASLMFVRSLVRGIEYLQGEDGFIMTHEVFLYLFDAVPMVAIMSLYLWIHPGRLVRDISRIKEYTWPDESNIMLERR
ncbi:RTM1 [Colletotrichum higginsianum]|uniref:RTM1 n=1 Tax=Colletotrichum higginsianum (strain IMI 349063) TaxID=759273 RepID=H1VDB0_COLHI|nr:RTM1 protein [Colletotrichum higginsianum IMI 349063]OBR04885.1 RTM1 protein [Colletotrichum higginsianum IMI 349063]CCF38213.1 RTM1 [Colletotrichum higginsianum]